MPKNSMANAMGLTIAPRRTPSLVHNRFGTARSAGLTSAIDANTADTPNAHHRGDSPWSNGQAVTTRNAPANTHPNARSDELSRCCVRLRSSCATFLSAETVRRPALGVRFALTKPQTIIIMADAAGADPVTGTSIHPVVESRDRARTKHRPPLILDTTTRAPQVGPAVHTPGRETDILIPPITT